MCADADPLSNENFKPFMRLDRYGDMGYQPQPVLQRVKLVLATILLVPIKFLLCMICISMFWLIIKIALLLPEKQRASFIPAVGKAVSRACLFCVGFWHVKWTRMYDENAAQPEPQAGAIVSNHVGWTDILVLMSRYFPSFVAKDGTQNILFIGAISQAMGCLYVKRRGTAGEGISEQVKRRITETATEKNTFKRPLLMFAEGTTSNGEYLLPFRSGAFLAGVPVKPVILRYAKAEVSPAWESVAGPRHVYLMLCHLCYSVECFEFPVYVPSDKEKADPVLYRDNVYNYMRQHGGLRETKATLDDKRLYHQLLAEKHNYKLKTQ